MEGRLLVLVRCLLNGLVELWRIVLGRRYMRVLVVGDLMVVRAVVLLHWVVVIISTSGRLGDRGVAGFWLSDSRRVTVEETVRHGLDKERVLGMSHMGVGLPLCSSLLPVVANELHQRPSTHRGHWVVPALVREHVLLRPRLRVPAATCWATDRVY